jgi:hypothetical protein
MMKDPIHPNAEGDSASKHVQESSTDRPSGQDRQKQYQQSRERAASGQEEQDRDAGIRRRAHEIWEAEGRRQGEADRHWSRAAEDLDREDTAIQREGIAGEKPGVRPQGDADFVRENS